MLLFRLLCLFSMCKVYYAESEIQFSSHWMVTESGLIQPRLDSPFEMSRPYDLLAFLNQEKRWDGIFDLYKDLAKRQTIIDKLWGDVLKYTAIGRQIAHNEVCTKAGNLNVIDWYAGLLEDGSKKIHPDEFELPSTYYGPNIDIPDCKKMSSLTFSMFAFEHLESMIQRENLSANPEFVLPELISPIMTIDQYGHWLAGMLRQNSSSWLHYNMASLYWRVRGSAPKAIECSRRALYYAPREFKDIALGSLGVVLHRSGKTKDAIIVLNAAIDHDRTNYVSHFTIANAYTTIENFNTSLKYYDETIKLNPRMELAQKYKYCVLCYTELIVKIKAIRVILKQLLEELIEYDRKEVAWPRMQAEFLRTIKSAEEFDYKNVEKNNERMAIITGLNIKEFRALVEKNSLIKYFVDGFPLNNEEKPLKPGADVIEVIYGLERLIEHVNIRDNFPDIKFQDGKLEHDPKLFDRNKPEKQRDGRNTARSKQQPASVADEESTEYETGIFMYPPTMSINRNFEDFDKEMEWPSNKLCKETAPDFPKNIEAIFPIFMPFENKGIRMRSLLTQKLGVPLTEEFELPWHPPTCAPDREAAFTLKKSKQQLSTDVVDTGYLRLKLLEYVSDGDVAAVRHMQDAEIGQRIYAATKQKLAPKWILLTLSSLYWRVRNNNVNALHCLLTAGRWVPQKYRDVVLVSLASVYLEMGHFDEALVLAEESFRISLYEPATNFLLAELNMLKKHRNTHMFHLKQVVRVESSFMNGHARNLLNAWACILKHVNTLREMDFGEGDICTPVHPLLNMVCEKDGENCQMTNIHCFSSHERETSTLVRLLQDKQGVHIDSTESTFFDRLIETTPSDKADRLEHHANFDNMVRTIETVLKGCGSAGCKSLTPDDLAMNEEDCNYQHLQLGYWLHIVSFRQLLTDSDVELPSEIASMTPSSKKVPECRITEDPLEDFYAEKLARVNTEGWEPVLTLMHQFSEIFDYFDYATLGAKIAKYVETRASSWAGALAAGWWCGAGGRGACAARCLAAARALAPPRRRHYATRALAALLHMQSKQKDAKDVAYLSFYMAPKSKVEAFLVAVSHAFLAEYDQAIWMYRYALSLDDKFMPAKACLHATMCLMFYGDNKGKTKEE